MDLRSQNKFFNLLRTKKFYFFMLFVVVVVLTCRRDIYQIMRHKDELIALCENKEIICENERDFYTLTTYASNFKLKNEYNFKREKKWSKVSYILNWDRLEFIPDTIININNKSDTYLKEITNYYREVAQTMDFYGIKLISGYMYKDSTNHIITIYLRKGGILVYRPNDSENDEYYKKFRKIKDDWYFLR